VKWMVILGLLLVLLGGGLFVVGEISYDKEHHAEVLGMDLSAKTTETRKIPVVVSGSILALGVVLTLVGALRRPGR